MSTTPDVTVVVIAYNDAERLPRAVSSVLVQSLRSVEVVVVDDCSTDATGAVADALAAAHPDRVRALHLPTNSGGCSRPRNVGVAEARGAYVMFLDSDDELDPDACRLLWEAASKEDADFSAGLTVRVHLGQQGRQAPWKPALYAQREVLDGLEARPELVHDTLSTNKCWKREFLLAHGLAFPEGMHYEDLVFTAEAYLAARRFVLVPERVYTWYVDDVAPSITNRREDLANLQDRLEAHRRIDRLFAARGLRELKLAKDVKFIRHDLRLYVNDFLQRDASWREAVLDLLVPYLDTIEPDAPAVAGRMHRVEVFYLQRRDVAGLLSTFRYLRHRGKVSETLVRDGDRLFWGPRHLDTTAGRDALDVTELGLDACPHRDFPFFHQVTELRHEGDGLLLSGTSLNQLGRLDGAALCLRFSPRAGRGTTSELPLVAAPDGDVLRWSVLVDVSATVRPLGLFDELYDVTVQARAGGEANVSPLTLDPGVGERPYLPVRPRLTRLTASHLRPYETRQGNLALRLVAVSAPSRAVRRGAAAVRRLRPGGTSAT